MEALYAVLDGLSKTDKKKFLMFVTGIEALPRVHLYITLILKDTFCNQLKHGFSVPK